MTPFGLSGGEVSFQSDLLQLTPQILLPLVRGQRDKIDGQDLPLLLFVAAQKTLMSRKGTLLVGLVHMRTGLPSTSVPYRLRSRAIDARQNTQHLSRPQRRGVFDIASQTTDSAK